MLNWINRLVWKWSMRFIVNGLISFESCIQHLDVCSFSVDNKKICRMCHHYPIHHYRYYWFLRFFSRLLLRCICVDQSVNYHNQSFASSFDGMPWVCVDVCALTHTSAPPHDAYACVIETTLSGIDIYRFHSRYTSHAVSVWLAANRITGLLKHLMLFHSNFFYYVEYTLSHEIGRPINSTRAKETNWFVPISHTFCFGKHTIHRKNERKNKDFTQTFSNDEYDRMKRVAKC